MERTPAGVAKGLRGSGRGPTGAQSGPWLSATGARVREASFTLVFDVVRRFAQPLGIELPKWEGRVIETKKGVVRLLPVAERAKQLFGDEGAEAVADWILQEPQKYVQGLLFPEMEKDRAPKVRGRGRRRKAVMDPGDVELERDREATTLDRVHAAMLLQASGRTNALRALLKAEEARSHKHDIRRPRPVPGAS
ncbi:MAG: hypothetical protein AB1486_31895 [Planctomycetota bacterium]